NRSIQFVMEVTKGGVAPQKLVYREQKLGLEVLGANGVNGAAKSQRQRFPARVRESNNQAGFAMKLTPEIGRFHDGALAPGESKFEKPEIGHFRETTVCGPFGRKLQKIFPLPSTNSEPENVRILLHEIRTKLDKPHLP